MGKPGRLNCHLTQRSGDIALGIPFNLACYATLTQIIAQEAGLAVGEFAHTIVDAHIYCAGRGFDHGGWYDHVAGLKSSSCSGRRVRCPNSQSLCKSRCMN